MRILWLCNIVPPMVAEKLNIKTTVKEGWITGTLNRLIKNAEDIELGICMPVLDVDSMYKKDIVEIDGFEIACYRFLEHTSTPWIYDKTLEILFMDVIRDFKPDMIHIFGTEYPHALACAKAYYKPERLLVGLQGMMGECAKAYHDGVPENVVNESTFRDMIKGDNIARQKEKFQIRANMEKETLLLAGHVAGRTAFDREAALSINENLNYHKLNESLRDEFYEGEWKNEGCNRHEIFMSQSDYPLKGFHTAIEAMAKVVEKYPDSVLKIAGNGITAYSTLKEKLKIGTYGKYCRTLIDKYDLSSNIEVLGMLNADAMKEQYLKANVFVIASTVENSPNSMGEAMLLGTPVVVAKVGGIPSMATENESALFFEKGDVAELASRIISVFESKELSEKISNAEKKRSRINHDRDKNYLELMEIYKEICR